MEPKVTNSILTLDPGRVDALAASPAPFHSWRFLSILEESGSVGGTTGWEPHHVTLAKGRDLVAFTPSYLKRHSYGEFIFDWAWAAAYERHQVLYYPKLVAMSPFTPATATKLWAETDARRAELAIAVRDRAAAENLSSAHFLFCPESELPPLEAAGFLPRESFQYHWQNRDYESFDGFLATLKARKRKQMRREREEAARAVEIVTLEGEALTPDLAPTLYRFYLSTHDKRGGLPYLNQRFFELALERMKDDILLFLARRDGRWVAGSFHFKSKECLWGRYWGAEEDVRFLHFELCYYQAIDYATTHRIPRVEAGAGGEHKLQRGFLPSLTYSAHWIAHPAFRQAIANYIQEEKRAIQDAFLQLAAYSPYANV